MLDQALILQYLVGEHTSKSKGLLFAAFIDLQPAFDSISRDKLEHNFEASATNQCLL